VAVEIVFGQHAPYPQLPEEFAEHLRPISRELVRWPSSGSTGVDIYYLAWHLREDWKPLLLDDEQPPTQPDPVAKASRSTAAKRKTQTKRTTAGEPCHSAHRVSTRVRNTIRLQDTGASFEQLTQPTPTQARARADRRPPTRRVVTTDPAPTPTKPRQTAEPGCAVAGNFGLAGTAGWPRSERMTLSFAYQNARSVPGSILLTRKLRKKKPK
jgi:hypothetical protein